MIISTDIFKGAISVPYNSRDTGEYKALVQSINLHEHEFYIKVLGKMYPNYVLGVQNGTPKYLKLKNGGEFDLDGIMMPFVGLDYLCAMYIYFHHTYNASETSNNGEVQITERVNADYKRVEIWNTLVNLIGGFGDCITETYQPTLRNFLEYGDYENWQITDFEHKNRLGL